MKIALITPHYYPAVRGNAVTVRRLEKYLGRAGCEVAVFSLDALSAEEICTRIKGYGPDLIHGFHGCTGGRVACLAAAATGIPFIISPADVDETVHPGERVAIVSHNSARLLTSFFGVSGYGKNVFVLLFFFPSFTSTIFSEGTMTAEMRSERFASFTSFSRCALTLFSCPE